MQTNKSPSVMGTREKASMSALMVLGMMAIAGCSNNPSSGSAAYKEGELGNGDFLFACDDGVACLPYSGDAKKFPDRIATGSTFDVRFVSKDQQGTTFQVKEKRYEGITTEAVSPYVGRGTEGFTALQPGWGTVIVRDNRGTVVDFVTLTIVRPEGLVVYDADYDTTRGKDPPRIQSMNLKVGAVPSYRVVAEHDQKAVAGAITVEWESADSSVVDVESYSRGVVNLRAKGVGKTTVKATGAALTKEIAVEVTQ